MVLCVCVPIEGEVRVDECWYATLRYAIPPH